LTDAQRGNRKESTRGDDEGRSAQRDTCTARIFAYAWNAGYDPSGLIRFFDKIATREGYVNGAGWFRTHPPFYQRMVDTRREIMFLAAKSDVVIQTSAFEQMKRDLVTVTAAARKEEMTKPSLKITQEEGCEPPKRSNTNRDSP
jgi:predicted Zn-dependent protease